MDKKSVNPDQLASSEAMISWLHQKPADLNLHCFHKRASKFQKVKSTVHL